MMMANSMVLSIVAAECTPEVEAKFNQWYNEVHIPMIFPYKRLKKATRYQRIGDSQEPSQYLALYEFENAEALADFSKSPEFVAAGEDMRQTWQDGDIDIKWVAQYQPITTWDK
jgi:heme-degrading monooxygenase HmoA